MIYDIHHDEALPSSPSADKDDASLPPAFLRPADPFCGGSPVAYHTPKSSHRREGSRELDLSAASVLSASSAVSSASSPPPSLPAMAPVEEFYNPRYGDGVQDTHTRTGTCMQTPAGLNAHRCEHTRDFKRLDD